MLTRSSRFLLTLPPLRTYSTRPTRMPVEPATTERAQELRNNYDEVLAKVHQAASSRSEGQKPRLVAVTKYKPLSDIQALYDHGVRHFGENYPQELEGKAEELPQDIAWHFIGTLQSNKCKLLAAIPNLFAIETLTSLKSANALHKALSDSSAPSRSAPLNIFIQVNTSGEEQKSGLPSLSSSSSSSESTELVDLAAHILTSCSTLRLAGLMTIGSFDHSTTSSSPNPDFLALSSTRTALLEALKAQGGEVKDKVEALEKEREGGLELSMGMSNDYEEAIGQGSTNVRVGSSIVGAREKKA